MSIQPFFCSSKTDITRGSISMVTVLDSPGASSIRRHPTRRLNGSPADSGMVAYTCAISAPARLPLFFTAKLTVRCASSVLRLE